MEYRIFRPIDSSTFELKWKSVSNVESRTDIYFLFTSVNCISTDFVRQTGLKLRHKHHLELKTRTERLDDGQENWKKQHLSFSRLNIEDTKSILKSLRKHQLEEIVKFLENSSPMIVCSVKKYLTRKRSIENGQVEFSGLLCQFIRLDQMKPISDVQYFETICVDSYSDSPLNTERIRKELSIENDLPMGFPEFLHRQYEKLQEEICEKL